CITLGNAITTANNILNGFVREVREARSDVDGVSRELHSLQSVLELLNEDASLFPPELAERIPTVLEHCARVVDELDAVISSLNSDELSRQDKRAQWLATGRQEVAIFRTALEAHKAVLGLALDLVGATAIRDATSDIEPNRRNTIERRQNSAAVMEDVSRVLVEMSQLRMRLPGEFEKNETEFSLYDYMTCLKSYAEKIIQAMESEHEIVSQGPPTESPPSITKSKGLGKFFAPIKHAISESRPQTRSTTSTGTTDIHPATPIIQASLVRRGSRRLSVSFKKLPMWNSEQIMAEPEDTAPNAVFGVSLQKSMQVAKGTAKTHHSGHGGSSRREFPLCMQKCCFFLKNEGVEAPDIFAEPGDSYRVQKLKDIFSSGPTYGEDVNWTNFGVYDAADLILLFLSQLPKPLISESIAKQWIALSRQAMLSGSHATRLDRCIDFWEEALGGLRGPSRTLFKLLLNLWADVAEAEERNNMTAERLAGVLIKPLMHITSTKYETDFMLS
ncbi:hypothetical protein K445DRAFT_43416, partial [Daldinia sp. EC12]